MWEVAGLSHIIQENLETKDGFVYLFPVIKAIISSRTHYFRHDFVVHLEENEW